MCGGFGSNTRCALLGSGDRITRARGHGGIILFKYMEDLKAKFGLSDRVGIAERAFARVGTSPRLTLAVLVTVLAWECGVLLLQAYSKLFDYDELLTFYVSNLHPFSRIWRALQAGVDGMSPSYYFIVRLGEMLPGDPRVTLRVPSILAYILTLLSVYWFARKRLPAAAGLAAVFLVTLSPFREYALEARAYSLLVGFLAISAVLWQRIGEKRIMTPLFALFLTVAVACHHYAVFAIASFGMAEVTWICLWHRIRWGVWGACVLATVPAFLDLPILLHMREVFGKNFYSRPSWGTAVSTYTSYFGLDYNVAFVLVLFLGLVLGDSLLKLLWQPKTARPKLNTALPEIILVGGFLFYPALLVVLTKLMGGGFTDRYGWPAILGIVLGVVFVFRSFWLKSSSAYLLVALLIAFVVQSAHDLRLRSNLRQTRVDTRWIKLAELSRRESGIPIVIGSPYLYLEAFQYAPSELRERLVSVVDADMATRLLGTDTLDKLIQIQARFIPLKVNALAPFLTAHQRFILLPAVKEDDWFTQYLVMKGFHLGLFSREDDRQVYIVEE